MKQTEGSEGGRRKPVRERHEQIRQLVQAQGFVSIDQMAREFAVTPQTIRRDINLLSDRGIISRHHGGAGMVTNTENITYSRRRVMCRAEKQRIARLVARHVPNRASLFINMGTTNEAIAKALCHHERLRVITNNLNVAMIMSRIKRFEVIVAGGLVRRRDGGIVGESTIDFIRQFRVDYGLIGISGIDMDGALLDFDYREVRAARAIMDNSRQVYLATDHTKFGRNAMVRLGDIGEVTTLFTDSMPPSALVDAIRAADTGLEVAAGDDEDGIAEEGAEDMPEDMPDGVPVEQAGPEELD